MAMLHLRLLSMDTTSSIDFFIFSFLGYLTTKSTTENSWLWIQCASTTPMPHIVFLSGFCQDWFFHYSVSLFWIQHMHSLMTHLQSCFALHGIIDPNTCSFWLIARDTPPIVWHWVSLALQHVDSLLFWRWSMRKVVWDMPYVPILPSQLESCGNLENTQLGQQKQQGSNPSVDNGSDVAVAFLSFTGELHWSKILARVSCRKQRCKEQGDYSLFAYWV